jgi:hypothetical protein
MKWRLNVCLVGTLLAAWACAPGTQSVPTPMTASTRGRPASVPTPTDSSVVTTIPDCYYVWASRELPELSARLNTALQSMGPGASGSAYAFGEDCVLADGARTFSAMETDFRTRITIRNLTAEDILGNWIADIMQLVESVSASELPGTRPGRVEFEFAAADGKTLRLSVDIGKYRNEGVGLRGAKLFRLFYAAP